MKAMILVVALVAVLAVPVLTFACPPRRPRVMTAAAAAPAPRPQATAWLHGWRRQRTRNPARARPMRPRATRPANTSFRLPAPPANLAAPVFLCPGEMGFLLLPTRNAALIRNRGLRHTRFRSIYNLISINDLRQFEKEYTGARSLRYTSSVVKQTQSTQKEKAMKLAILRHRPVRRRLSLRP